MHYQFLTFQAKCKKKQHPYRWYFICTVLHFHISMESIKLRFFMAEQERTDWRKSSNLMWRRQRKSSNYFLEFNTSICLLMSLSSFCNASWLTILNIKLSSLKSILCPRSRELSVTQTVVKGKPTSQLPASSVPTLTGNFMNSQHKYC